MIGGLDDLTNPSEPIFVPRAGAVNEDDGYLLAICWNRQTELSELCIYGVRPSSAVPHSPG